MKQESTPTGLAATYPMNMLRRQMELRHIRYFLAVADALSFSRAAEHLKVAQSALSKQIRDLEEELGGKLFQRTTAKVSLTEMGEYFRQQMRRSLMQIEIAMTGAQQLAKGAFGTLRIGCDWRIPDLPIAAAARLFREANPRVGVEFVELPFHMHLAGVLDHSLDIGIVPSMFLGEAVNLDLRKVRQIKLKVLLPSGHPLAARRSIAMDDLKNERWLVFDAESIPGAKVIMAQILRFKPRYATTTVSISGLVANVAAGYGIGLAPELEFQKLDDTVVAFDTDCTPIDLFAVSLKEAASPLAGIYLDIFEKLNERRSRTVSENTRRHSMHI